MLSFTQGMWTIMVGVVVTSPSLDASFNGVGRPTAIYDTRTNASGRSCDSLGGGGVVVRCEGNHAQWRGNQASSSLPEEGKANKGSVDQLRGDAKPIPSTSPGRTPGQNPGEQEKGQERSANSLLQEECDMQLSTVRTHCLLYLALRAK